jgi:hypothetical protein
VKPVGEHLRLANFDHHLSVSYRIQFGNRYRVQIF